MPGASTKVVWDEKMEKMGKLNLAGKNYLLKEDRELWSRSGFGYESKCDLLTNSICESFNNWILKPREVHIIAAMDMIRRKLMGGL